MDKENMVRVYVYVDPSRGKRPATRGHTVPTSLTEGTSRPCQVTEKWARGSANGQLPGEDTVSPWSEEGARPRCSGRGRGAAQGSGSPVAADFT